MSDPQGNPIPTDAARERARMAESVPKPDAMALLNVLCNQVGGILELLRDRLPDPAASRDTAKGVREFIPKPGAEQAFRVYANSVDEDTSGPVEAAFHAGWIACMRDRGEAP